MTTPIYRCQCGTQSSSFMTDDVCEKCGTARMAAHLGTSAAAQPTPAAVAAFTAAAKAPAKAAPITPMGNPAHPTFVKSTIAGSKVVTVTYDAVTMKPINDTRVP